MQIEDNIPLPSDNEIYQPKQVRRFHLEKLEVGQSVVIDAPVSGVYNSALRISKRDDAEFKVKSESIEPPKTRVWRVA
jgi:hypothetical protein